MAERRRGLGRGLGALIPSAPTTDEQNDDAMPPTVSRETSGQADTPRTSTKTKESAGGTAASRRGKQTSPASGDTAKGSTPRGGRKPSSSGRTAGTEGTRTETTDQPKTDARAGSKGGAGKTPPTGAAAPGGEGAVKSGQKTPEKSSSSTPSASTGRDGEKITAQRVGRKKTGSTSGGTSSRRADMGAALSKSAGGRRPVDFFFEPSSPSTKGHDDAASGGEGRGSRKNTDAVETSGPRADVSRETAGTASADGLSLNQSANASDSTSASESSGADAGATGNGERLIPVPGAHFGEIPVASIHPNRKQPRQEFDPDDMAELVHSIREIGVLQPIVIRPSREGGEEKYELVMGERRWRATQEAGLETIPAIVRDTQDVDLLRDALLENLHRSQLNPLEEAAAYQQLLQEFGTTQDELSRRIGRSRPQISNTIRLLRLPALVQRRVAAGILSAGHARALLALSDPAAMEKLAQRIVSEGLSVRSVEEIIQSGNAAGPEKKKRRPTAAVRHHERFDYIADAFADKLDTSVKIALGARKGKMTIEFASVDDLNRIISVLDPSIERD